ncbi:uncharacterized protein B0T15DRAFT_386889 [Chaetomium strumarium]|uniref:GAT domain-containing protein n=1 Tax=Chaetomium strumarium TaxID=1170767 RepID=A0AAJ0H450_9PEZI|nr:hypothetical protein B0T15DRAFT_386889 [Chaetomium strumarium]
MAGFSMNKVLGTMKKRPTFGGGSAAETPVDPANETPEAVATRCVKQFCNSVGSASGDDVVFLPSIVEAAVASPVAAAECARLIRKFMSKDYWTKPSCQYNAVMLIRILVDNPGPGFTRYMDKKFVDTAKELLRTGRDASVRQILMETLDSFENTRASDEGLALMIEMWKKEKEKAYKAYGGVPVAPGPRGMIAPPFDPRHQHHQPYYQQSQHHSKRLPDPIELANRLEEARTSAKLLEQVVACTPPLEVLSNDLIKEFADRCTSASRSIQGYMSAENPGPDNDTMESLIDTNEQLQQALNHHHRAVLQAKKQLGVNDGRSSNSSPAPPSQRPPAGQPRSPPPQVPRKGVAGSSSSSNGNGKGKSNLDVLRSSAIAGPSRSTNATPRHDTNEDDDDGQDPFRDPEPAGSSSRAAGNMSGSTPRLSYEPFHPGFGGSSSSAAAGGEKARREPATAVSDEEEDAYRATPKKEGRENRF